MRASGFQKDKTKRDDHHQVVSLFVSMKMLHNMGWLDRKVENIQVARNLKQALKKKTLVKCWAQHNVMAT